MHNDCGRLDIPEVLAVLFHPRQDYAPAPAGAEDCIIPVADSIILGGRFFPSENADSPTILFFHGNGEIVADYDAYGFECSRHNLNFLAVDYRGYGQSTGTPSASNMIEDSHTVLAWTKKFLLDKNCTGPLAVMGRSLGSAPALELASLKDAGIAGLIIESGFAYTMPLLELLGVDIHGLCLTEKDGFGNYQKISRVTMPTYILHAQFDAIIPLISAETLHANCPAPSKEFSMIPGAGHNNIIEIVGTMYFEAIVRFTGRMGKSARRRRVGIRG